MGVGDGPIPFAKGNTLRPARSDSVADTITKLGASAGHSLKMVPLGAIYGSGIIQR